MTKDHQFRRGDRLDRRIADGRLKPRHVRAVAKTLAAEHAAALPVTGHGGEPAGLLRAANAALKRLRDREILSGPEAGELEYRMHRVLTHDVGAILERHAEGRVRRVEAWLAPDRVRVRGRRAAISSEQPLDGCDTAAALAGLSCAVRAAGDHDAAERLLAAYALAADDYSIYGVIDCFETLCACMRAAATSDHRRSRAQLADWLAGPRRSLASPALIVLVGGVATGKSTLAKALFSETSAPRVVADRVRASVLDSIAERAGSSAALDRAWSTAFDDRLYVAMLRRASRVLASGRPCVVDSCSPRRSHRERAAAVAEDTGARLVLCICKASPKRIQERLSARDTRDGIAAGDWSSLAGRLAESFEHVADDEPGERVRVSTDAPVDACAAVVASTLAPIPPAVVEGAGGWPTAVTFDCWKTLLEERDWVEAHGLRVDALCAAVREDGADLDREVVSGAFDAAWQRHMDLWRMGVHSGAREVARWSLEQLRLPLAEAVVQHLTERFQTASHTSRVDPLDGARETLRTLHAAGVGVALVCDTGLTPGRVVRRHLDRAGLLEPLGATLFSDEVGVPKPDGLIFRSALDALGVRAEDAIHVGDLYRTDVQGARDIGMGSVRITAAHDDASSADSVLQEADAVVASHAELLAVLRGWMDRAR